MKIVLWIGKEANQKALANKINELFPISGIILEDRKTPAKITPKKIVEKAIEKFFLPSIAKAWWGMKRYYDHSYADYPAAKTIEVENINSEAAFDFTTSVQPDLIVVSGTRLVREKMLSICPSIGILNLHTGLSPYIKGGPNCTNWCIATGQYHLIGNTIMWIDAGIDTGNLVTTEFTPMLGNENLGQLHIKVMEHAHSLYLKAIAALIQGKVFSVRQEEISKGTTYYNRQWTLKQKFLLVKNLKSLQQSVRSGHVLLLRRDIQTIPI